VAGKRARGARYEARTVDLAAYGETALLESTNNNTTNNGVRAMACVCAPASVHASPLESTRESWKEPFSKRAAVVRDLRSAVVASIITATIVPEFIGISIKLRSERTYFLLNDSCSSLVSSVSEGENVSSEISAF